MSANNAVRWQGLQELKEQLRKLPKALADVAAGLMEVAVHDVVRDVSDAYHQGPTGNLKKRVRGDVTRDQFGASALLKSAAPHVWIYERGTKKRRTANGANRGRSPAHGKIFARVIAQRRRRLEDAYRQLLRDAGLEVRG
jgi:hypothetical protein